MKKLTLSAIAALAICGAASTASAQLTAYGLSTSGTNLVSFDISNPTLTTSLPTFTGLSGGETISAIDFRPSNQLLYGYSSLNQLYTINLTTGVTTFDSAFGTRATPATNAMGSDVASTFPPTGSISIDVNPNVPAGGTVGALRIVSTAGGNYRYVYSTSTLQLDDTLTYSTGGVPQVVSVAYTNPDNNGGTGTSLYYLDATTDSLYTTLIPNDGVLTLVGALGAGIDIPTSGVGFDVPLFGTTAAYASFNNAFYSIDLTTGAATLAGALTGVNDIAVAPEPSTYALLALGGGLALFVIKRRNRVA